MSVFNKEFSWRPLEKFGTEPNNPIQQTNKDRRVRKAVIIFGLFLSMVFTGVNPASGADKYALLIGIGDYSRSAGFSDLAGPLNDIRLMKETLESDRFGFEHVTVLLNAEATHSRIEKAFKSLAQRLNKKKAGVVYIYYSGHGSQTLDLNGDEKQLKDLHGHILPSYDQTWVAFGSRLKKDASPPQGFLSIDHFDILDDEISEWLGEIAAGCDQVVFVSDSCHSGSVSRGGIGSGIRRGPADTREHLPPWTVVARFGPSKARFSRQSGTTTFEGSR